MEEGKKRGRWAGPAAFLLCFLLLLGAADAVLTPKSGTMAAFYAEPKNSVDVAFVGGSHGAAAFSPTQMWQERGFTSYNLFSWSQPAWTSYHYVKEVLQTQTPRVVVVEAFGFLYGNTYLPPEVMSDTSDDFSLLIRPGFNRVQLAMAMSRWQARRRPFYRYASLLRYHSRWQALSRDDFAWGFMDHTSTGKGFGPIYTTEAFPLQAAPEDAAAGRLYPGCEEYLRKLIQLAREEDFALVLAMAPYVVETAGEWGAYRHLAQICEENGVPFIDYNGAGGKDAGIDFSQDLAEHAHVNIYGAAKISAHMAEWLDAAFDLPDRRQETAYGAWQRAAEAENWDNTKMRLRIAPDAGRYLAALDNARFVAVLVSEGALDGPGNAPLAEGFAALGLDGGVLRGEAAAVAAVVDGGRVVQRQTLAAGGGEAISVACTVAGVAVAGQTDGENARVTVAGRPVLLDNDGLFAVVLDRQTGEVIHSVVFRPQEGSITRTD